MDAKVQHRLASLYHRQNRGVAQPGQSAWFGTKKSQIRRRHQVMGWSALLLFLTLGAALEWFHAFKSGFYLDPTHSIRREMWTLAHAHGTLLAVIQLVFAASLGKSGRWTQARLKVTSHFLIDTSLLIPLGFSLGGVTHNEGDPSAGVFLVPVGAVLLFIAILLVARTALGPRDVDPRGDDAE